MKRTPVLLTAGVFLSLAPLAAQVTIRGEWEAEFQRNDRIHLQVRYEGRNRSNWGSTFDVSELTGLDRSRLTSRAADMRFELRRDAGTLVFEGRMDDEGGWGDFSFTPNPAFEAAMEGYGYSLSDRDVFTMAMVDISREFMSDLRDLGYRNVAREDLISMGIHGARPEFIRAIAAAGFPNLPVRTLVQFRIHGVAPEFVAQMRASGFELDAQDLVQARIHGVSGDYARELGEIGLTGLSFQDLVQFRIHGVTLDLARAARATFPDAAGQDLIQMRIHGVSPDFVRAMGELGYDDVTLRDLVQFRIHGVSEGYLRELREAGFAEIPADLLIQMRIHNVSPAFAREMKSQYEDVTPRDLIDARIHGRRWVRRGSRGRA